MNEREEMISALKALKIAKETTQSDHVKQLIQPLIVRMDSIIEYYDLMKVRRKKPIVTR